ncbi:T-complex protein 1 subunit beta-like [Capsicum annuum]|uniref:T-complex protein 1 subunit beta-like n=1 Tax=Capsicum annuum TaxID=4072 RepID=UPI001FB05121|nr:T-complex protein 1 subunit beta-like [Capsicum annuum]
MDHYNLLGTLLLGNTKVYRTATYRYPYKSFTLTFSLDISKVQDDEVGDGTTSVVVLAGELLREAEKLVNSKIHPMTIILGYRKAAECARNALLLKVDNKKNAEKFRSDLMSIAITTLSSKILSQDKEHFAKLSVDAFMRLKVRISFAFSSLSIAGA